MQKLQIEIIVKHEEPRFTISGALLSRIVNQPVKTFGRGSGRDESNKRP